jgi:hypothetical protein
MTRLEDELSGLLEQDWAKLFHASAPQLPPSWRGICRIIPEVMDWHIL